MHVPINVKSSNNISKWQMRFNSAFKALINHTKTMVYVRVYNACFDVRKPVLYLHIIRFYKIKKYYTKPHCAVGVVMEKQSVFCKVI
jgi:hypothetical protein